MKFITKLVGGVIFLKREFVRTHAVIIVHLLFGTFWNLRKKCLQSEKNKRKYAFLYESYLAHYGAWIGLGAKFKGVPILPHGLHGIFISNSAVIGENVVIFHQVTIGSNMIKSSVKQGAPVIEDNVYIGCGAKLIGCIKVGKNARIGANAIIVKDIPNNSVAVTKGTVIIKKDVLLDNEWIINNV